MNNEQRKIVEESFIRIEDIFEELTAEGDVYFFCFILLIYNYKRYYSVKQERKSKNRKLEFNKLKDIKDITENDN